MNYEKYLKALRREKIYDFRDKNRNALQYEAIMLDRLQSMFEYKNLPETIPARNLERLLLENGFAIVTKGPDGNLYAFDGGLDGQSNNAYYDISWATIANAPLNFNKQVYFAGSLKNEPDAVLVRNDAYIMGLLPIIERYSVMLAENDLTIWLAVIQSRAMSPIIANNDRGRESAEKYLKDLERGELGAMVGNMMHEAIKIQPLMTGSSNTLTNLIEMQQFLWAKFFNELGVDMNPIAKRESIMAEEAGQNEPALRPLIDDMLDQRKDAIAKINDMFDLNIEVELHSVWKDISDEADDIDEEEYEEVNNTDTTESSIINKDESDADDSENLTVSVDDDDLTESEEVTEEDVTESEDEPEDTQETVDSTGSEAEEVVEALEAVEEIVSDIADIVETVEDPEADKEEEEIDEEIEEAEEEEAEDEEESDEEDESEEDKPDESDEDDEEEKEGDDDES